MGRDRQRELILDIESLKSELQESDYKVIKCAEAICLNVGYVKRPPVFTKL